MIMRNSLAGLPAYINRDNVEKLVARKMQENNFTGYNCDPFDQSANLVLGAGAQGIQVTIQVGNDADFVLIASEMVVTDATLIAALFGAFTVTISDSTAGRNLSNAPVHALTYFGTGQLPRLWYEPKLFQASSTILLTFNNLIAAAQTIYITLTGYKIFYQREMRSGIA